MLSVICFVRVLIPHDININVEQHMIRVVVKYNETHDQRHLLCMSVQQHITITSQ